MDFLSISCYINRLDTASNIMTKYNKTPFVSINKYSLMTIFPIRAISISDIGQVP